MPSEAQIAAVYDFENVLEAGLQALLDSVQIKSFTTQDFGAVNADGTPKIDFQKARPRVEISFNTGAGQGQYRPLIVDGAEVPVETSFKGSYTLDIITGPDIQIHAAYRAHIRYQMHARLLKMNGLPPMLLHKIQDFQLDGGTSPTFKAEEGYLRSVLKFDIDFSIQDDAWETIASTE